MCSGATPCVPPLLPTAGEADTLNGIPLGQRNMTITHWEHQPTLHTASLHHLPKPQYLIRITLDATAQTVTSPSLTPAVWGPSQESCIKSRCNFSTTCRNCTPRHMPRCWYDSGVFLVCSSVTNCVRLSHATHPKAQSPTAQPLASMFPVTTNTEHQNTYHTHQTHAQPKCHTVTPNTH